MNKHKIQENWFDLCNKLGPKEYTSTSEYEAPAAKELAKILREMADHIEAQKWPQVLGYYYEQKEPFVELTVVLSNPWGG